MKYIEEYLVEKVRIKPLGTLKLIDEEVEPCTPIGKRVVIDDIETDIVVWHADYSKWLENKYDIALIKISTLEHPKCIITNPYKHKII